MTSEEKQIEEMAKTLDEMCDLDLLADCGEKDCSKCMATALYNAGYRRQREGEWVRRYSEHTDHLGTFRRYDGDFCSVCGVLGDGKFCPNCGAKMKGGAE